MASVILKTRGEMLTQRVSKLSFILGPLISSNVGSLFRLLPSLTKYLLCIVFLLNARSWPLAWHARVFAPMFKLRLQYRMVQLRAICKSRAEKRMAEDRWLDSISPIGADPLNFSVSYTGWAAIDDCDLNGHLSNSSYPKTLDCARFKTALAMFPQYLSAGGRIALAATHFNFIREIPIFASYEVRAGIAAWDHKWLYVLSKFVTKPSSKDTKHHKPVRSPPSVGGGLDAPFNASLYTTDQTTTHSANSTTPLKPAVDGNTDQALNAVAASLASEPEPDGAIVNTIAVSRCVFKVGRVTVPPALVFACCGFSTPPAAPAAPYSHSNPPPHWHHVKPIMEKHLGGSAKALQTFLKGGWRDIPEGERWWESALGGVVEEKRKAEVEIVQQLVAGMNGVRSL